MIPIRRPSIGPRPAAVYAQQAHEFSACRPGHGSCGYHDKVHGELGRFVPGDAIDHRP
jgi:hypothetical protein